MINGKKTKFRALLALALSFTLAAASLPAAFAAKETTSAVKEKLDWNEAVWPHNSGASFIGNANFYVGSCNDWNDYSYWINTPGGTFQLRFNSAQDNMIASKTWLNDGSGDVEGERYNLCGENWGYLGAAYKYRDIIDNPGIFGESAKDTIPPERWLDVNDISAFQDNGYAVFKISNVSGDIDNAYLSIVTARDLWCLGLNDEQDLPVSKEKHLNNRWFEPYASFVAGVPMNEFYDAQKGGEQSVAVPLSRLTNAPAFKEVYGKTANNATKAQIEKVKDWAVDLRMFRGMGIAKKDNNGAAFSADVSAFAIVAMETPTDFMAEKREDGSIGIDFLPTTDTDVSFKVARHCGGQIEYFDAPDGTYVDATANPAKTYTYAAVAVDNTYGVVSEESNSVTIEATEGVKEIYEDFALEDTWESTCNTTLKPEYESWPKPAAVGAYAEGEWDTQLSYTNDWAAHAVNGVINGVGRPRTYYIHDMYYGGTQDASITYRTDKYPGEAGQYWGFNGVRYTNTTRVPHTVKNFADIQNTGYAVFDIKLEPGSSTDGVYLALSYVHAGLQPYLSPNEQPFYNFVGVPLADYYDASKSGFQTIAVPLSAFDTQNEKNFSVILDSESRHGMDREPLSMAAFHGMGLVRLDSRGAAVYDVDVSGGIAEALQSSAKPFAYTANRLAIVNVEAPSGLSAEGTGEGIALSWNKSDTQNVSNYEIQRNGKVLATVSDTAYTDASAEEGVEYTYAVRAVSFNFANVYSSAVETTYTIPSTFAVKLFAGQGETRYETKYTHDGVMSADFYAQNKPMTGYIANYSEDGRLKGLETAAVSAGAWATAVLAGCAKTDTVKAFLWDENQAAAIPAKQTEVKALKVLAIGDGFSEDATTYLHQIAAADGVDLDVTNLYIDGSTLETHWNNVNGNIAAYRKDYNGSAGVAENIAIADELACEDWDVIALQQASRDSVDYSTYQPYLNNLVTYLKANEPGAGIMLHETWEYSPEAAASVFGADSEYVEGELMWADLKDAYAQAASDAAQAAGTAVRIIPSGSAVRQLLYTQPAYNIWRDGLHMSLTGGRYLTGLVWYKALTGGDIAANAYVPDGLGADDIGLMKQSAAGGFDL